VANDVLLVGVQDRIATVTLNRPEARNALNHELRGAIPATVAELGADPDVDVVIITGADPAFCAGLDLKELSRGDHDLFKSVGSAGDAGPAGSPGPDISDRSVGDAETRQRPFPRIGKPIIGAINGVAVTGGFELALNCDFLIASERARFADTHARVGVQPGWGLTVLLPQAIGLRRAKEMSATGNYIDAATALAWGLVNHVVPHEELLPHSRQLAADIISNDRAGVTAIFATYDAGSETTAGEAWLIEARNARRWLKEGGGRSEDIATRRRAIQARGKAQAG
jgi:enoyl-CoA hydratase